MPRPLVIAHRTCPLDAPENSLAGVLKAAELGADAVEIDLRVSLDARPFLMHDITMRRTTGHHFPLELTPACLIRRFHLEGTDERVPGLDQALLALPPNLLLAVDVKTPWSVIPLVRYLKQRELESRTLIWCQSPHACRYALRKAPGVEVAYLKTTHTRRAGMQLLDDAVKLGVHAVSAHWHAVTPALASAARRRGLRLYSYNEGYKLDADKIDLLDGIITDLPVEARALIEARTPSA